MSGDDTRTEATRRIQDDAAPKADERDTSHDVNAIGLGMQIGDYVLREVLASGGFGTVYKAQHTALGHLVAIKIVKAELAESREVILRFMREAQAINEINHPNIVDMYDHGVLPGGYPYLVMEYLPGRDLAQYLKSVGRITPARCLQLLEPVCLALGAAHDAGFVHRDVKASNVFLVERNQGETVKLLDFGIAKLLHPPPGSPVLTRTQHLIGSPLTMAPEQLMAGAVGPATDVYAVGVLLFHLLIGHYPFSGVTKAELERNILERRAPRLDEMAALPAALSDVVMRCLEKSPVTRYQTMGALLGDLRAALSSSPQVDDTILVRGTALHIALRARPGAEGGVAPEVIDEALDHAEQRLGDGGYAISLATGSSILAVRVDQPMAEQEAAPRCAEAAALAAELQHQLSSLEGAGSLDVAITVHRAPLRVSNERPVGGPLMELATWASWVGPGVFVTAAAQDDLVDDSRTIPGPR